MKKLLILSCLAAGVATLALSQNKDLDASARDFVDSFAVALSEYTERRFIDQRSMTDTLLCSMVDEENTSRGVKAGDPNALTFEIAADFMDNMRQRILVGLGAAIERALVMNDVDLRSGDIVDFTYRKSYWEPPVADIDMKVEFDGKETVISFMNLSIESGQLVFGPSTRLEIRGYEVQDFVAFQVVLALTSKDADLYVENVLPDQEGFAALLDAAYETLGIDPSANIGEAYDKIRARLFEDFNRLLAEGEDAGIEWEHIEMTWSGMSSTLQGEIYQISIPIQFSHKGKEYRFLLDYCTQLRDRPDIFLPGEFRWEGEQ